MQQNWTISIFIISFILIALIKHNEHLHLKPFYIFEKSINLKNFENARKIVSKKKIVELAIWESMLTGRTIGIPKSLKKKYQQLGISHVFTPSGFHLSSITTPISFISGSKKAKISVLILIMGLLTLTPGFSALKRMTLIKVSQQHFGQRMGFFVALFLDVVAGTFSKSPLSFSLSLFFLGIIYSGKRKLQLIFLFFTAQCVIAYFNHESIPVLNIIFNPILNFFFAITLPFLFVLAIPLWGWQLNVGTVIISFLNNLVEFFSFLNCCLPFWEIHIFSLMILFFFYLKCRKYMIICFVLFSGTVNLNHDKSLSIPTYSFKPRGRILKIINVNQHDLIYFEDGKCKLNLVRGIWWENCSPRKRSSQK